MSESTSHEGLSSADIKKQILEATKSEKAKQEVKDSGLPITGMLANEINASESTPKETKPADSKPYPEKAAEKKADNTVDLQDWAKKKGINWTSELDVLSALYKSEQAFHKKRQETKAKEVAPQQPVSPSYTPPSNPSPVPNKQVLEGIAREYNLTVEDAERLIRLNRDFYDAATRQDREKYQRELDAIRVENQKNSVFRELSSDPHFRNPKVGAEFHKVLDEMMESDPQSFESDPNAYKRAYDRALINIARRDLEGQPLQEGLPPIARFPTNPPKPLGIGSGGGSYENERAIDPAEFAKKSPQEKRAILDKMGLISQQ